MEASEKDDESKAGDFNYEEPISVRDNGPGKILK